MHLHIAYSTIMYKYIALYKTIITKYHKTNSRNGIVRHLSKINSQHKKLATIIHHRFAKVGLGKKCRLALTDQTAPIMVTYVIWHGQCTKNLNEYENNCAI